MGNRDDLDRCASHDTVVNAVRQTRHRQGARWPALPYWAKVGVIAKHFSGIEDAADHPLGRADVVKGDVALNFVQAVAGTVGKDDRKRRGHSSPRSLRSWARGVVRFASRSARPWAISAMSHVSYPGAGAAGVAGAAVQSGIGLGVAGLFMGEG